MSQTFSLYLDGELLGSVAGVGQDLPGRSDQIGMGFTGFSGEGYWPDTPGGWYGFVGQISDVKIWSEARTADEVGQDMTTGLSGALPGLEADYPLDEGQGLTAHDLTPNAHSGTLSGFNGDLPTWLMADGEAIDLGDDGITYNGNSPRQGPNNFQNFPIIVTTAAGGLEGWLGGSTPDSTFRVDVYASAGYSAEGAGQAQDFLGSLEVTTDQTGQVVFAVPFTAPEGLPVITATATDPLGNTSEMSAERRAALDAPTQFVRIVGGEPVALSAASGDGIAIEDPDAGPLDPEWALTLSVSEGTLSLSSLAGLVGSGDGTGNLQYEGSLSSLDAALDGLLYTPAAGSKGTFTVSVSAHSDGAPALEALVNITDGTFAVTTNADSGPGSLRQAILNSNLVSGGVNTISFAIPGGGVQTIALLTGLPAINNPVLIDGFSQPGYDGTPLIVLSGVQAGGADGLTITGSDVTVRGLDIGNFLSGAGILISGAAATGDTITANNIGTDPSGSTARPNGFGVQILNGASENTIGGATAAAGNLIAFNTGPGVQVEGDSSLGNQITANRDFSNDAQGSLQFDGSTYVTLPDNLVRNFQNEETIEASFETTGGGVILGYQTTSPGNYGVSGWVPALYVGTDGRLYGDWVGFSLLTSTETVADGRWHQVALVADAAAGTSSLYLDGELVGSSSGAPFDFGGSFAQIGTGYTAYFYPDTNNGWYGFVGQIANVRLWNVALSSDRVEQDMSTLPAATAPGLEADYPLNDGQGVTVHDVTSNDKDAPLSGSGTDLPTWVVANGEAIDLGGDAITYNASSPRQGPNNFQNFPIIAETAPGALEGWLGGSTPDTSFLIDIYASAGFDPDGAGQAQDYLGSLEVTTDDQGNAVFQVPFAAPDGLPVITATATDSDGNTSEVSPARQTSLQAPPQEVLRDFRRAAGLRGAQRRRLRAARYEHRAARRDLERHAVGHSGLPCALRNRRTCGFRRWYQHA